jgi:hypothetical protein
MADEIDPKYEPGKALQNWMKLLNELREDENWKDDPRLFSLWEGITNLAFGHRVKDVPEIVPAKPAEHNIKDIRAQWLEDKIAFAVNKMVKDGKNKNEASKYVIKKLSPFEDEIKNLYNVTLGSRSRTTVLRWVEEYESHRHVNINKENREKHHIDRIQSINDLQTDNEGKTGEEIIDWLATHFEKDK